MAFICDNCKHSQKDGTKQIKIPVQVRSVTYPAVLDNDGRIKKVPTGLEIVKELKCCPDCAQTVNFNVKVV